jgi:type I restriction enzyme R subunit
MYSYISQISNFSEVHWEKTFIFLTYLNKKLPKRDSERISITDSIDLDSFRIQKTGESKLELENMVGELEPPTYGGIMGMDEEERELLSQIIEKINSVFGSELKEDDKVTIQRVEKELMTNHELMKVLMGDNSEDVKLDFFKKQVKDNVIDIYSEKFDLYKMLMNDKVFPMFVSYLYQNVITHHRKNPF